LNRGEKEREREGCCSQLLIHAAVEQERERERERERGGAFLTSLLERESKNVPREYRD